MLVGCVRPSRGRAWIAGHDVVTEGRAARAHIGYVPENIPLYDHLRVNEFLRTMAALQGLAPQARAGAVARVSESVHLNDVAAVPIRQLSRGYRQRVAIAQALLSEPPLLILDEPTNGLDPRQIIECRALIASLSAAHAVLVTSHILSEIERLADRVAILLDGRLLALEAMTDGAGRRIDLEQRFLELTAVSV
jgi:ABC-2 type transport system ATP-binding protein